MPETFDLFGGDLSPAPSTLSPVPVVPAPDPKPLVEISVPGMEKKTPEQLVHLAALAIAIADEICPASQRGQSINPHLLAFVAQARHYGHTDPALTPISVDSAGRRLFDEVEVTRFANELLRGVRSARPAMTPERWAEAIAKAREANHA